MSTKRTTRAGTVAGANANLMVDSAAAGDAPPPAKRGRKPKKVTRTTKEASAHTAGDNGQGSHPPPPPIDAEVEIDNASIENGSAAENGGMRNEWVNSTTLPQRARILNIVPSVDPVARFAEVLERTLNTVRDNSMSGDNSRLVNRLTTAKELPVFSGDPLEWLHFKEEYELSSELGAYGDRENISRLFKALKGEARDVVNTLLATSRDAAAVIRTLDLHYGNKRSVAEKIANNLKKLTEINAGSSSLTHFATELRNATVAFKSLNLPGYLHSPDLIRSIGSKLPTVLKFAYNRYAASVTEDKSELEKLSDFLYAEAELAASASIFNIETTDSPPTTKSHPQPRDVKSKKNVVAFAVASSAEHTRDRNKRSRLCAICKRDNHSTWKCNTFISEPIEKRWALVRKHRLCFNCLATGHGRDSCTYKKCATCEKNHHILLHGERKPETVDLSGEPEPSNARTSARIEGPKGSVKILALLDEGSTITLIDKNLSKGLGFKGDRVDLTLVGVNDQKSRMTDCEKVCVKIKGAFEQQTLRFVVAVENFKLPSQSVSRELVDHLRITRGDIKIEPYHDAPVRLLIGQDNWRVIVTREVMRIRDTDLAVSRSLLGWALHGPVSHATRPEPTVLSLRDLSATHGELDDSYEYDKSLDKLIKDFFELENIGVNDGYRKQINHVRARKILKNTTRFKGNHWETGLLWKEDFPPKVDSLSTARNRLFNLEKRLDRDPKFADLYYKEMQRFIDNGYVVKADLSSKKPRVWYVPHFGVTNINKPDKVRIVFDAAAKTAGVSLNDQLESGPDLLRSLPGVIIRFRRYAVAFKGDIRDMFLRVKVIEPDRGAQRILFRGSNREKEPEVWEVASLMFGPTCSPCNANYVKNENAKRFAKSCPLASESIENDSYVDDYMSSCKSEREAADLIRDVVKINAEANFMMHAWASNKPLVLPKFPGKNHAANKQGIQQLCDQGTERVLGLIWDTNADEFRFNVKFSKIPEKILRGEKRPTKREVLRVIMSIFDPLGLLAPFILKSKILMQQIWASGVLWDNEIRVEEFPGWLAWLSKLSLIENCRIPRCLTPREFNDSPAQLHIFCDASLEAFAAAAYLRYENSCGLAHVSLITARNKIAPMRSGKVTVPRLELQAALLGARLARFVEEEIKMVISRRYFWSDSTAVLHWIRSEPYTRQMYVANRLIEISELTTSTEWRWVPTNENPADDATRFENDAVFTGSRWFIGPDFLQLSEDQWPANKVLSAAEKADADKLERKKAFCFTALATRFTDISVRVKVLGWRGLLALARRVRTAADRWLRLLFLARRREGPTATDNQHCILRNITSIESLENYERYWYRFIQDECFGEEIRAIKKGKELKKGSRIASLRPFLDNFGILRAMGRVTQTSAPDFDNNPIILDSSHFATRLLIAEYHRKCYHGSKNTVFNEIRQKFHIVRLRAALHSYASRCIVCRVKKGKPRNPLMGALPASRVDFRQRPFSHCGTDWFGPLTVKIGRRREKRWGALFTCMVTRAIHLELASSLSASSAIMALQRLAARRGAPLIVYSDNGTNFRGACRELKDEIAKMDKNKLKDLALARRIEWRFNPPDAPFMGGAWERLVRSVKTALSVTLYDRAVSEEVLHTILVEIEHSINSRPLTHVSLDLRDDEALTPNHFLIGTSSGSVQLGVYDIKDLCLKKQWKLAQNYIELVWKRWLREYLPNLIPRQKWTETEEPLEIGDIVMIVDLQAPRNVWRKGRVIKIIPAKDKQVRQADVQTPYGIFNRPTRKLIKLLGVSEVQD